MRHKKDIDSYGTANEIQALTGAGAPHHTCGLDKFWTSTEGCVACWSGSGAHTCEQEKTEPLLVCEKCGAKTTWYVNRLCHDCWYGRQESRLLPAEQECLTQHERCTQPTTAPDILHQALEAVKDREQHYGDAKAVFNTTIDLFRVYTLARVGKEVTAQDTAIFNICQKIARTAHGEGDPDNWRDIAGYAALAAQVTEDEG